MTKIFLGLLLKTTAFEGKCPIRIKNIDHYILEQCHFNYLGYDISYENDYDCDNKLGNLEVYMEHL